MIAEPYISIRGFSAGEIKWHDASGQTLLDLFEMKGRPEAWQPYADFEREKLRELKAQKPFIECEYQGYAMFLPSGYVTSGVVIGYSTLLYSQDIESNRLLKRAEFLKAVCEKEGVEWLPDNDPRPTTAEAAVRFQKMCDDLSHHLGTCNPHADPDAPVERDIVRELCDRGDYDGVVKMTFGDIARAAWPCGRADEKSERDYYTKAEVEEKLKLQSDEFKRLLPSATVGHMLDELGKNGVSLDRLIIQIDGSLVRVREQTSTERYCTVAEVDEKLSKQTESIGEFIEGCLQKKR